LSELINNLGKNKKVSVSRELTKKFEETFRGTLEEAFNYFSAKKPKGEFVIVIAAD